MFHIYIATQPNSPWVSTDTLANAVAVVEKQRLTWGMAKFSIQAEDGRVIKEFSQRTPRKTPYNKDSTWKNCSHAETRCVKCGRKFKS